MNIISSAQESRAHPAQIQGSVYEAATSAGSGHSLGAVYSATEKLRDRMGRTSLSRIFEARDLELAEKELDELKKSLNSESVASAATEFAKLNALGSGEKELRKLRRSLAGGSPAALHIRASEIASAQLWR